ncbi:MAG: hypothetical protein O3B73_07245 [bacterium]|nr:hypothetical protein [bacterium]
METVWLVGAKGLSQGTAQGPWQAVGASSFSVNSILQTPQGLVVASDTGLWQIARDTKRWVQLHDEIMTSALGLASAPVGIGMVVASAYGIATGQRDALGVPRWTFYSDELAANERYSNVVIADPDDPMRWLVGTEAGVLVREHGQDRWRHSSLIGRPVRGLCWALGAFWAGVDRGGVWTSQNGVDWSRAGTGLDGVTAYAVTAASGRLLVGLEGGVAQGDGTGRWVCQGPRIRTRVVAAQGDLWLAGASPGGLWVSSDQGKRWQKTGAFVSVRSLLVGEA